MKTGPILLLLLIFNFSFAQNQPKDGAPVSNCENVTMLCQNLLADSDINKTDSINHVLSIWKQNCGETEPILRLKILMDINYNQFVDTNHRVYIDNYVNKYIDRITATNEPKYNLVYENQKDYYDYIPLRSSFDNWTRHIAADLLSKQQPNSSAYLLCLLLSDNFKAFTDEIQADTSTNPNLVKKQFLKDDDSNADVIFFNMVAGIWVPVGDLSKTFNPSPQLGFKINIPFLKTYQFGIGVNLRLLNETQKLPLTVNDSTQLQANSTIGLSFGANISKEIALSKNMFVDFIGSLGFGRIHTDAKMPDNYKKEDQYYSLQTFDLGLGIDIKRKIFKSSNIGLNITYNYTPYQIDSLLTHPIGAQSISTGLLYIF